MSALSGLTEAFTENDESIKHLLRQVVYMFYPHQCIIIMEAILFHNVLFEEDLVKLCCMHKKVFRSFCNKLIEDKLLFQHTQKEETQPYKLFSRTYFYVHNIEAIDSIKWKIHTIVKKVKEEIGNFSEPQGYICPTCHTKYSLLDAASLLTDDRLSFECSICNDHLIDDDISQEQKKGQEKLEKLMSLVEPIIQYLKIVDDLKIDDNNFESTLMKYVPAFSDSIALYSVSTRSTISRRRNGNDDDNDNSDPSKKAQATIHVSITADDEDLKRERLQREDRNRKLRQNALPSWHQESTVGKMALGRIDADGEIAEGADTNNANDNDDDATTAVHPSTNIKQEGYQGSNTDADSSTVVTSNTTPLANVNFDNIDGKNKSSSLPSLVSDTSAPPTATTASIPTSAAPPISTSNRSLNGVGDGATTNEELDALSAYYSQLRERQAAEEEEEEEQEENELDDLEGMEDIDDDDLDAFNEDLQTNSKENDGDDGDVHVTTTTNTASNNVKQEAPAEKPAEDIDEDDFDLEMFESDEN